MKNTKQETLEEAAMKTEGNMITDWLNENRNPEIDKQVEQEVIGRKVVEYCKQYEKSDKYNVAMLAIEFGYQLALQQEQDKKMYSDEDMRNAFESAREFNSLDGIVDVHIVLPMGGDMSDLQPLHFTFDDWFEKFKNK